MSGWVRRLSVWFLAATACGTARASEPPAARSDPQATALARLDATLSPDDRATVRFLEHLGWRFVPDASVREVVAHGGAPCRRKDLDEARAAGDLVIRIPASAPLDAARLGARLREIADGTSSRCAYQLRLAPAVREATRKLAEAEDRGDLSFPKLLGITSPWWRFEPPMPEWASRENLWEANGSPAGAIEAVYSKPGLAECYSAQWIAVFAAQYELYGKEFFDAAFKPEEVAVGPPDDVLTKTTFGKVSKDMVAYARWALLIGPEDAQVDATISLARHGPAAFVGLTGIVRDARGGERANQNFVVVSVSPRVSDSLVGCGTPTFYEASCAATEHLGTRLGRLASASVRRQQRDRLKAYLEQPLFSEFIVYVHPFGVVPLGEVVLSEMEKIEGPVHVMLYLHGREDAFFQRYRQAWRARWLAEQAR
jgi:hypothetical protein